MEKKILLCRATIASPKPKKKHRLVVNNGLCPSVMKARRFVEIFGVQLNNQNFFGEISRILFALFVHRRLYMQCSYVAIAHLMQFFFFGVEPFRK